MQNEREGREIQKTPIEWVFNPDGSQGYTWNPITGCVNGCEYCYARKLANGRLKVRYLNDETAEVASGLADDTLARNDPFYPRFWPGRLNHPLKIKKLSRIFTCDMSDLFGICIPENWTKRVLDFIKAAPQHRFYLLTKQPQNLAKWSPFPDNAWVGVTATDWLRFFEATDYLKGIQAKVKYLSIEPLLRWSLGAPETLYGMMSGISWIIVGALTCTGGDISRLSSLYPQLEPMPWGRKYILAPKVEWIKEIVVAADQAGVKVFLKDSLLNIIAGQYYAPFYDHGLWLRQEVPDG